MTKDEADKLELPYNPWTEPGARYDRKSKNPSNDEECSLELKAMCQSIQEYMDKVGAGDNLSTKVNGDDGWYRVEASRVQGQGLRISVTAEWAQAETGTILYYKSGRYMPKRPSYPIPNWDE